MSQTAEQQAPPESSEQDPATGLIGYLYSLANNPFEGRKAMMSMRSSLGERGGISPNAVQHVGRYVPAVTADRPGPLRRKQEMRQRNFYLVAGLFSLWHVKDSPSKLPWQNHSLGKALRRLRGVNERAAEVLIADLTSVSRDQVGNVLIRTVTMLAQHGYDLNWYRLARDLTTTSTSSWRRTQRSWASDFYSTAKN